MRTIVRPFALMLAGCMLMATQSVEARDSASGTASRSTATQSRTIGGNSSRPASTTRPAATPAAKPSATPVARPSTPSAPSNNTRPTATPAARPTTTPATRPSTPSTPNNNSATRPSTGNAMRPGSNGTSTPSTPPQANPPQAQRPPQGGQPGNNQPGPTPPGHATPPATAPRPGASGPHRPPVMAPAPRPYRPVVPSVYHRPVPPPTWRPVPTYPTITGILGITFGTALNLSLNHLYGAGYNVAGYGNGAVYLTDVMLLNYFWDDATLYYNNAGGLAYSQFYYSTPYSSMTRFNEVFSRLCSTYGQPISITAISNGQQATWFGVGNTYITLTYEYSGAMGGGYRYFTTLTCGN